MPFRRPRPPSSLRPWRAAAWLSFLAWSAAWAGDRGPDAARQTPAALYHNYCSVCHGDAGDGNSRASGSLRPPPRDFTTAQSAQELTREHMVAAVRNGVPGTAMTGWRTQLDEEQIGRVVDYVRTTFMRPTIADANPGRRIYARVCSVCHGDNGAGSMWASANLRPAPRDFSAPGAKVELTRERMLAAVSAGRPGTAMQGYAGRLAPDEIGQVVDYIRTSIMRVDALEGISGTHARGVPVKADMGLPLPGGLRGDPVAGRRFYEANCATCHGARGDGQGPRAYFINPKPRVFTSEASRATLSRPAIFAATSAGRRGSEMPAWDKVLSPQEIANVSEYVFRAFIEAGADRAAGK